MAAATYVPRHRAVTAPTGKQTAREQVAEVRVRHGQSLPIRARHAAYGAWATYVRVTHPDDRLPLGFAATTGQEAA